MNSSVQASYDADIGIHFARKECHPETRAKILNEIESWASQLDSTTGYWICGMAGTGKSTIAMSICSKLKKKDLLAATFFCSRQIPECREYKFLIPTLAYQLARFSKTFAYSLSEVLGRDPDVVGKKPDEQISKLLVQPWAAVVKSGKMAAYIPVVVVDALDECKDISVALKPLILAIQGKQFPGLKFLLTSRPEQAIQEDILHPVSASNNITETVKQFILHQVQKSEVSQDLRTYIYSELESLSLPEEQLEHLTRMSGELFIYAATVIKFVKSHRDPHRQKDRFLSTSNEETWWELCDLDSAASSVFALCARIIRGSASNTRKDDG